jgi:hypothetical protein
MANYAFSYRTEEMDCELRHGDKYLSLASEQKVRCFFFHFSSFKFYGLEVNTRESLNFKKLQFA